MRTVSFACVSLFLITGLAGCSAIDGYPVNPIDTNQDLATFSGASGPAIITEYLGEADPGRRQTLRNQIVNARIAAYDIAYQRFEGELYSQSSLEAVGGDLAVLTLNGIGATTGGATAKAALAAASAGVTGAKASVDKDVFYNKALPAVLAQMEASRTTQLALIQKSLQLSDADYPLSVGLSDLIKYRDAGSLPVALNILTANVNAANADAKTTNVVQRLGPSGLATSTTATFATPANVRAAALTMRSPGPALLVSPSFIRNLP